MSMPEQNRNETEVISGSVKPITKSDLLQTLGKVGVVQGDLILAHATLSRIGWVVGGVQTVLEAVLEAIGSNGTLVMPGFSSQLSDPTEWERPAVPETWHQTILDNMPVFDPERTPTRGMSKLNEAFRALSATKRSHHPIDSFLAYGAMAEEITKDHPPSPTFGAAGPLGKLYNHGAKVLFLGSGFDTCTSFHLAEYDSPNATWSPVRYPSGRQDQVTYWAEVEELEFREHLFAQIGADFETSTHHVTQEGPIRLFEMQHAVEFAREWLGSS